MARGDSHAGMWGSGRGDVRLPDLLVCLANSCAYNGDGGDSGDGGDGGGGEGGGGDGGHGGGGGSGGHVGQAVEETGTTRVESRACPGLRTAATRTWTVVP